MLWVARRFFLILLGCGVAQADVATRIPDSTYGSDNSPEAKAITKRFDENLRGTVAYWRQRGFDRDLKLDSTEILPSWFNMKVGQAILELNPDLGTSAEDVIKHVAAQHMHFLRSPLHQKLKELEADNNLEPGTLVQLWFDQYAQIRYGYGFPNFYNEVMLNGLMDKVYGNPSQVKPIANAYYGRFPKLDLTKYLPLELNNSDQSAQITAAFLSLITSSPDTITFWDLVEHSTEGMAARIVFLPMPTQEPYDYDLSLGHDLTVGSHEVGHTLNGSIGESPRQIDEYMGDMISAIYHRNGKIGAHFAKVMGIAAERIRKRPDYKPEIHGPQVEAFLAMAKEGAIRDLDKFASIDHITRYTSFADPYEAGNPLRSLSWGLWKSLEAKPAVQIQFEEVLIQAMKGLTKRNVIVTARAQAQLNLRKLDLALVQQRMLADEKKRRATQPQESDKTISVEEAVSLQLAAKEVRLGQEAVKRASAGEVFERAAIQGDYINAEYIRELAYAAQTLGFDELLPLISQHASSVMAAKADYVESGGRKHLVFFRRAADARSAAVRSKLRQLFDAIDAANAGLEGMGPTVRPDQVPAVKMIANQLQLAIGAVQEYEVYGDANYLANPYPQFAAKMKRLQVLQKTCGDVLAESGDEDGAHGHHHH